MKPSEQLQRCILTGEGMTAELPGLTFTIHPRQLPGPVPPKPCICAPTYKTDQYIAAICRRHYEKKTVARLQKVKAMVEELEKEM